MHLAQRVRLRDLNNGAEKEVSIRRRYVPVANPLRFMHALADVKADYCGLVQDVELSDELPEAKMYVEPWILTQVNPGGKFVTPIFGEPDFVDYYEPAGERQRFCDGYAELGVAEGAKYKVAYRSVQTCGHMAYLTEMDGGFGEFENGGPTIGLDANRDHSYMTTSLWFFFGTQQDMGRILKVLLGIDYKF